MSLSESVNVLESMPNGVSVEKLREIASSVQRVAILKTLWYPEIIAPMEASARKFLIAAGMSEDSIETITVPGSYELPLGVIYASQSTTKRPPMDFAVALGCVVKGETPHFDFVSSAATTGLMRVQLDLRTPIGFGLLTVDTVEQAEERKEKGAEAAQAAFFMYVNKCVHSWGWKE